MKRTTNLPCYSLEKVEKKWALNIETIARMEEWAKEQGISLPELANNLLGEAVKDRRFYVSTKKRVEELREKNRANRERMKELRKKGQM